MEPTVTPESPAPAGASELHQVRRRRAELREAINAVEDALAAAGAGRPAAWGERVHGTLANLDRDVALHIAVTEGPDGLHQAILAGDLRLANAVAALAAEHQPIAADLVTLQARTAGSLAAEDIAEVREDAVDLLGRLVRHRQRGADLVYEAFHTDIGGVD
jgi:hypothetical protein